MYKLITSNRNIWFILDQSTGDSGGPLTILGSNGERVLAGVVKAASSGGCELGFPVIFTRVHSFLDWIEAKSGIKIS